MHSFSAIHLIRLENTIAISASSSLSECNVMLTVIKNTDKSAVDARKSGVAVSISFKNSRLVTLRLDTAKDAADELLFDSFMDVYADTVLPDFVFSDAGCLLFETDAEVVLYFAKLAMRIIDEAVIPF